MPPTSRTVLTRRLAACVVAATLAACGEADAPSAPQLSTEGPTAAPMLAGPSLFNPGGDVGDGARPVPVDMSDVGAGASLRLERGDLRASASVGSTSATHYTQESMRAAFAGAAWGSAVLGVSQYGGALQAAVEVRPLQNYPTEGASYLVVSSGDARNAGSDGSFRTTPCVGVYCDIGGLDVHIQVPAGATQMQFDYRMWSRDTVPYNDYFKAFVIDANGVATEIVSHTIASEFPPGGSGARLSPNTYTRTLDVTAFAGQQITLRFETADALDFGCATGAFVDNLRFLLPGLTLTKVATDNATTVAPGSPIGFTLEVTNTGGTTLSNVVLTDALPGGLGFDWNLVPTAGCAIAGTAPETLTCNFGTLAPGESRTVRVWTATVAASCGVYTNKAYAGATGLAPVSADAQVTVPCAPPPVGVCDGGVTKVVVKYIGAAPLAGEVRGQRRNPGTSGILPAITTGTGANTLYTFSITPLGGQFTAVANGRLANNFRLYVGSTLIADFHTSCSAPIYPGMVLGGLFEIVEVYSKNGGQIGAP